MSEIDLDVIESALKVFNYNFPLNSLEEYDSGDARDVFLLESNEGREMVLYLCTNTGDYEERFKKEQKLIEMVNQKTDIPTQNLVYSDFSKEKVPYLFYIAKKVDGYDPIDRYKYLPRKIKTQLVREVGRYLGELHQSVNFKSPGEIRYVDGEIEIQKKDWTEFIYERSEERLDKFEKTPFSDLTEELRKFVDSNLELAKQGYHCCLHWDITPDNIIVDEGRINAVIDWEKAISGPPEWDLAYSRVQMIYRWFENENISRELEKEFFEGYRQKRQLDGEWKQRIIFYDMVQSIGGMADFPNWTQDMDEQRRKKEENFFRTLFERRSENLKKVSENEISLKSQIL